MGFFGDGKKSNKAESLNGDGLYVKHVDNLPVAVAVAIPTAPLEPSPKSSPALMVQQHHHQQLPLQVNNNSKNRGKSPPPPMFSFTRSPTVIPQCPVCGKRHARTRIRTAPDWITWVSVAMLLIVFWPLCWIPLVTDACRKTTHSCSSCNAEVGTVRPFQDCFVKHRS